MLVYQRVLHEITSRFSALPDRTLSNCSAAMSWNIDQPLQEYNERKGEDQATNVRAGGGKSSM